MLYRARRACTLNVESLGRTVDLEQGQILDSDDPVDAQIIARWGKSHLRTDNVEAATAAPGEMRTTTRPQES